MTIRVLLRNGESGWADVIQRQERGNSRGLFCQMVETRHPFWFAPALAAEGRDGAVTWFCATAIGGVFLLMCGLIPKKQPEAQMT